MLESGKFLDYSGPVDYKIIDHLLGDLKKTKEFKSLPRMVAKRTYSILVECLENIAKHSIKESLSGIKKQPFIYALDQNDKIIIKTGNIVPDDKITRLVKTIRNGRI